MRYNVIRYNRIQYSIDNAHHCVNKTVLVADFRFEDQNTGKKIRVYFAGQKGVLHNEMFKMCFKQQ